MTQETNNINKRATERLQQVYELWTNVYKDENGDEVRTPDSEEEAVKSRKILDEVGEWDIIDVDILEYYDILDEVLEEYEDLLEFIDSPNGKADEMLDKIYNLWTRSTIEDDIDYHSPANEDEIERSWKLISEIENLKIDNEAVKERLESYRGVLEANESNEESEDDEISNDDQSAWEKLEKIYGLWSEISTDGEQEFRKPSNKKEIKKSRKLLKEIESLNVTNKDVLNRMAELKGVIDSTAAAIPNYTFRILITWFFSLGIIYGFFYYPTANTFDMPVFEHNTEWFVTEKGGYLTQKSFVRDEQMPDVKEKIYLKKGTQLKPLGRMGTYWIQVEAPNGQRGFISFKLIKGARFVAADKNAVVYDKIGGEKIDSIAPGTKATILKWTEKKINNFDNIFIKIKLEDGRVKWAHDYHFNYLIYKNLPSVNQTYTYRTTKNLIQKHLIGDSLSSMEKHYGPATSIIEANGKNQAFFKHLVVIENKKHHHGIIVNLDDNNVATDIEYINDGDTKFYDHFPLMNKMWELEKFRFSNESLYLTGGKSLRFEWWENFKDKNWFTTVIGWVVSFIAIILGIFLIFSIPRLVVAPITQFFALTRFLNNGLVILINLIIYFAAAYLFFIYMVVTGEQWLVMAIASVLVFIFWTKRHYSNIMYNRCPACLTMYVALDEGSTFTGRSTTETMGTYEDYKGIQNLHGKNVHLYNIRDKKTTEHVDHYLDHRMCARCYYEWNVDRDESEEHTTHY
jgi:hypothetical protein